MPTLFLGMYVDEIKFITRMYFYVQVVVWSIRQFTNTFTIKTKNFLPLCILPVLHFLTQEVWFTPKFSVKLPQHQLILFKKHKVSGWGVSVHLGELPTLTTYYSSIPAPANRPRQHQALSYKQNQKKFGYKIQAPNIITEYIWWGGNVRVCTHACLHGILSQTINCQQPVISDTICGKKITIMQDFSAELLLSILTHIMKTISACKS